MAELPHKTSISMHRFLLMF